MRPINKASDLRIKCNKCAGSARAGGVFFVGINNLRAASVIHSGRNTLLFGNLASIEVGLW